MRDARGRSGLHPGACIVALAASLASGGSGGGGSGAGAGDGSPLLGEPSFVRILRDGAPTEEAFLRFRLLSSGESARYVNAAADLNGDGEIAAYEVEGQTQEEWLLRNALLPLVESGHSVYAVLLEPALEDGAVKPSESRAQRGEAPTRRDGLGRGNPRKEGREPCLRGS